MFITAACLFLKPDFVWVSMVYELVRIYQKTAVEDYEKGGFIVLCRLFCRFVKLPYVCSLFSIAD